MNEHWTKEPWNRPFSEVATEEDVYFFFRILFGRTPSEPEWSCHGSYAGKKIFDLFEMYAGSEEFRNRFGALQAEREPESIRKVALDSFTLFVPEKDHAVGDVIFETKTYEQNVILQFREMVKKGMTLLDVGANLGWYSLWGSRLVGSEGKVIAVEAGVENSRFLFANRELNQMQNIEIYHLAALDAFELLVYSSSFSNGFVRKAEASHLAGIFGREIVQGAPLDKILHPDQRIDVVKIDIEGSEYRALRGMEGILKKWRPVIFSEYAPYLLQEYSGVSGEEYARYLVGLGYEISVVGDRSLTPVGKDVAGLEEQLRTTPSDHLDLVLTPDKH